MLYLEKLVITILIKCRILIMLEMLRKVSSQNMETENLTIQNRVRIKRPAAEKGHEGIGK